MSTVVEIQKEIIAAISVQGGLSVEDLARDLKLRHHTVRYQLQKLLDKKALKRGSLLDHRALGLQLCTILFDIPVKEQASVLTYLQGRRDVCWLSQHHGAREFELELVMKDGSSLVNLGKELSVATGVSLANPLFAFQEDFYHWGLRFLSKRRAEDPPVVFKRRDIFEADALDIKLVKASRNTTGSSYRALAQRLGVPLSTINHRFARLIKAGVISEDRFFVVQSGPDIQQAQLLPSFSSRSPELEKKLLGFCQDVPNVTALVSCAGNWDYRIVVYGANSQQIFSVHDAFKKKFATLLVDCPLYMRRYRYPTSETGL